jgi:hypothetical protein
MRKFFGILLIIFGSLIALSTLATFLKTLSEIANSKPNFEYNSAYLFGTVIGAAMTGFIAYLLICAGRKSFKKKKEDDSELLNK